MFHLNKTEVQLKKQKNVDRIKSPEYFNVRRQYEYVTYLQIRLL